MGNLDSYLFSQDSLVGPVFHTVLTASYRHTTNTFSSIFLQRAPPLHQVNYTICAFLQLIWCSHLHYTATSLCQAGPASEWDCSFRLSVPRVIEQYRLCKPWSSVGGQVVCCWMWLGITTLCSVLLEVRPIEGDPRVAANGALYCGGTVIVFKILVSRSWLLECTCLIMRRTESLAIEISAQQPPGTKTLCGGNLDPADRSWEESPGMCFRMWQERVWNILSGLLWMKKEIRKNKPRPLFLCFSSVDPPCEER